TPLGSEITVAPFSLAYDTRTIPNGSYTLTAKARDFAGNTATSEAVPITIGNAPDTTAPAIQILNPPTGSILAAGTLVLWAVATDNIGVSSVQFKLNGVNLGVADTTSPYRVAWDTSSVASGQYTLTATVTDLAGNTTTSSPISVTVDKTPPVITNSSSTN